MNWVAVGLVLPWLAVLLGCYVGYQVLLQRRRILERLELVEEEISDQSDPEGPAEMKIGAIAPIFELPDLEGRAVSLRDFQGRRVLMIFVGPGCKFSRQLFPGLATLPLDGRDGRPELLLVSTGNLEENRAFVREFGLSCTVMLQDGWNIASGAFAIGGSPMGYVLDEQGAIASKLAMGAEDLLALAESAISEAPDGRSRRQRAPKKRPTILSSSSRAREDSKH